MEEKNLEKEISLNTELCDIKHKNIDEKIDTINETLDKHECLIKINTEDIGRIKTDSAVQNNQITNLNKAIEKLNDTIVSSMEKFELFTLKMTEEKANEIKEGAKSEVKKENDTWKWIVATILFPIIFYLLNYIVKR